MNEQTPAKRDSPLIGTILDRKYRIDRLLGMGGTGAVYAAWHLILDRAVAIKILHAQFISYPKQVERFRQEAQVMGKLGHDNFVHVIDFRHTPDGLPYLVMELVAGETLRARLRGGPLPPKQVLALFQPLCEALGVAHNSGIVHRDLKPDNLMLVTGDKDLTLKILDFGSSKLLGPDVPKSSVQFQPGTPYYVAPERLADRGQADHRVDIFSLGAILYEALSGRMAFGGETPAEAMFKILEEPSPRLGLPDARLSQALDAVIAKACAKDPEARYPSTAELLTALSAAVALLSAPVPKPISSPFGQPNFAAFSSLPSSGPVTPQGLPAFPRAMMSRPPSAPPPQMAPLRPYLLSDSTPLGAGVKQAVMLHVAQQLEGLAGPSALFALGPDFLPRLKQLVLTDWVDGVELQRLFACAGDKLGGKEGQRRLGRSFADVALQTVYKSLLRPGEPESVVRRMQVILRLWHSEGESVPQQLQPGRWDLRIGRLRTMDRGVAAGTAGFIDRYLEMAGASAIHVDFEMEEPVADGGEGPVWVFSINYNGPPEQGRP